MEKLSVKKRITIVRLYLSGLSFSEIAAKTGTSKGTVENVISELKAGVFPEAADVSEHIELLRELSIDLKKASQNPVQCAVGLAVLNRLTEYGLNAGDMERWPWILKSVKTEDDAQEFVQLIYNIGYVLKQTGLSLPALEKKAGDMEKKVHELEPISAKVDERKKQLDSLNKQLQESTASVKVLEDKLKWLMPRVQELGNREKTLLEHCELLESKAQSAEATIAAMNKEKKKVEQTGFSLKALAAFNQKVQAVAKHHGIEPADVRERLLHELVCLDKGLRLETIIKALRQQIKESEQIIDKNNSEIGNLQVVVIDLQQRKTDLEANIKTMRNGVSQEIGKIAPIASEAVQQLVQQLQTGREEVLAEVGRIRDESIEVGKAIGQYQTVLQENQWLNELLAMMKGESIQSGRFKAIVLPVARGINDWLQSQKSPDITPLSIQARQLVWEFEKWQT